MANRIKELRDERNWSLEDLAERANTSRQQVHKLETGERRLTVEWMQRLGRAFGVDPRELMPGTRLPSPAPDDLGEEAELVRDCIIAVEELLEERNDHRSIEERAELVARLFRQEREAKERGARPVSGAEILRLVRRA